MINNISIKQHKNSIEVAINHKLFEFDNCNNIDQLYMTLQNVIIAAYNQGQVDLSIDLTNAMWEEQTARNREPGE